MEESKNLLPHEELMQEVEAEIAARDAEIESICRWAAARAGVLVMAPKLSTTALIANDAYMVSKIAQVYGHSLSAGAIIGFLGGLGGSLVSALLTSVFPNPKVKIPLAVCLTYAVGKAAKFWVESGMPMPGDFSEYRERMLAIFDHVKTTVTTLINNPMRSKPLGDEGKDFLAEAGVDSDQFLGLSGNTLGNLLNGDLLSRLGSLKEAVVGVVGAAVASVVGKGSGSDSNNDFVDNAKHALSGIGSLLATLGSSALDLAVDAAGTAATTASEAREVVVEKVSGVKGHVADHVSDVKSNMPDQVHAIKSTVSDHVSEVKSTVAGHVETVKATVADATAVVSDKVSEAKEVVVNKAQDAKDVVVNKAQDAKEAVASTVQDVKETVAAKVHEVKDNLATKADDAKGEAKDTADTVKAKIDDVVGQAKDLKDQALDKAEALKAEALEKAEDLKDQAVAKKDELAEKAEELKDQAVAKKDELAEKAEDLKNQAVAKKDELVDKAEAVKTELKK